MFHQIHSPVFSGNVKGAMFGVELELEDTSEFANADWTSVPEGSLRDGVEFVTTGPRGLKDLTAVFDPLVAHLGGNYTASHRCSTHLHVNIQDRTQLQLYQIVCLYYLLEDILVATQGPLRVGNLFCLRLTDANAIETGLLESIRCGSFFRYFSQPHYKYGALNLSSPSRLGTLEFRFMRPIVSSSTLQLWADAIWNLVSYGSGISLTEILDLGHRLTSRELCEVVFGSKFYEYLDFTVAASVFNNSIENNYTTVWSVYNELTKIEVIKNA